jgi:hypothetical protein
MQSEFNAKTQRRKDAKEEEFQLSAFFPQLCPLRLGVFAPLR